MKRFNKLFKFFQGCLGGAGKYFAMIGGIHGFGAEKEGSHVAPVVKTVRVPSVEKAFRSFFAKGWLKGCKLL